MRILLSRHVPIGERLSVLQAADVLRKWYSLDDLRVCVLCDREISGRQIDITRDARGRYSLACPTHGCKASINEWFYHPKTVATTVRRAPDLAEFGFLSVPPAA